MSARKKKNGLDDLRERAEEKISRVCDSQDYSVDEVKKLVHELRVHQIELEMQNDALRQAQSELLASNEKYTDLYDFAPVSYLTLDEQAIIVEANLTLSKLFGLERSLLLKRRFALYLPMSERNGFFEAMSHVLETGEPQTFEARLLAKEVELDVRLNMAFASNAAGKKHCRISITDVSDLRKAEKELKANMKKLERSNRELQDFAFIASHDLQEPLRKILTFGNMLLERHGESLHPEAADYLRRMGKASLRMREMIDGLLDYSRVATQGKPFREVNLAKVIGEVVSDMDFAIEQAKAVVKVEALTPVEADPGQMRRLFQNLIVNALKFHGEKKPVIKIYNGVAVEASSGKAAQPHGRLVHIYVEDNGIGFEEEYVERIFALFQRLHGRSAYEGTGMGLAICRRIAERHHGAITAKSSPGNGSTFIVTLPVKQPREAG